MTIPPDMLEPLGVPPATQRRKRVPTPRAARNSVTKYATTSAPPCQDCGEEVVQQLLGGVTPPAPLHAVARVTYANGRPDRLVCYKHAGQWRRALGLKER